MAQEWANIILNQASGQEDLDSACVRLTQHLLQRRDDGTIRQQVKGGNKKLMDAAALHLRRVTSFSAKDSIVHLMLWLFDPQEGTKDPNAAHFMQHIPTIMNEYRAAAKHRYGQSFASNVLNALSNTIVYCGRDFCRPSYDKANVVESIKGALESGDIEQNSVSAALLVANLIGHMESKAEMLTHAIPQVCNVVRAALDGTVYAGRGWNPKGACMALANVSIADSNKQAMLDCGAVELLHRMLTTDWSTRSGYHTYGADYYAQAMAFAGTTLWNLSFKFPIEEKDPNIVAVMEGILEKQEGNEKLELAAKGLLFNVRERKNIRENRSAGLQRNASLAKHSAGHVMLSYCWNDQPTVVKLKEFLETNGFNVWIDLDDMTASTLEAMAKAVEDSAVVIVCMSAAYKESASCRTEGEYAYTLKKAIIPVKVQAGYQPEGWLGALVGSRLYFEFKHNEGKGFIKTAKSLAKELGARGRMIPGMPPSAQPSISSSSEADSQALTAANARIADLERELAMASRNTASAAHKELSKRLDSLEEKVDKILSLLSNS